MARANTFERRFAGMMYRPDSHWHYALALDADEPDAFWNLLDERASWFYEAVGAGPDMAPKRPGPSSAYLGAYTDKAGEWLDGGSSYRLHVPPDAPSKLFWSVTLYDVDTRSLLVNEQKIADRSSRMDLQKNADGSVDIYCGPTGARRLRGELDSDRARQEVGSPISGSTSRPRPISTRAGRWAISKGSMTENQGARASSHSERASEQRSADVPSAGFGESGRDVRSPFLDPHSDNDIHEHYLPHAD